MIAMGFLDKVKEQAATATAAAKEAAQKGQAKLDDLQSKRAADALLRDLGAATYSKRMGRADDSVDAEIERLVTALNDHEAAHGLISTDGTSSAGASSAGASSAGASSAGDGSTAPPPTGSPVAPPPTGQTL
jgi:hypothetical protein